MGDDACPRSVLVKTRTFSVDGEFVDGTFLVRLKVREGGVVVALLSGHVIGTRQ